MYLEGRWSRPSFCSLGLPNLGLIDKFEDLCVPSTVDFPLLAIPTFWARLVALIELVRAGIRYYQGSGQG